MSNKDEWMKIVILRLVEGLLTAGAFGVGLWSTIKSMTLEKRLDEHFDENSEEEDEE